MTALRWPLWAALVAPHVVVGLVVLAVLWPAAHAECTGVCAVADAVQIFVWMRMAVAVTLLIVAAQVLVAGRAVGMKR